MAKLEEPRAGREEQGEANPREKEVWINAGPSGIGLLFLTRQTLFSAYVYMCVLNIAVQALYNTALGDCQVHFLFNF